MIDVENTENLFPVVKSISPRTLAQDIVGLDLNDPKSVKRWMDHSRKIFEKVKAQLDAKGITMPTIVFCSDKVSINEAIKTNNSFGNIIHSQP